MRNITDHITKELVDNNFVNVEDYEICKYGLENLVISFVEILSVLIISIFFDMVIYTIFFLATLIFLRRYTGGFHARTKSGCYLLFVVVYFAFITIVKYMPIRYSFAFEMLSMLFTNPMVLKYAPIVNGNKSINQLERKKFRRFSIIITIILSGVVSLGMARVPFEKCILSIACGLSSVSITMLVAIIMKRRCGR